ncbi:MAG: hypothetical protein ACRYGG_12505 [Janthinobacterium lividum]
MATDTTPPTDLIGHLDLNALHYEEHDGALTVHEDVGILSPYIHALPDNLTVRGTLYLSGCPILALPKNLVIQDDLIILDTDITALPENLSVGRDLDLRDTKIACLPDSFQVRGSLLITGDGMPALPEGLHVGQNLDIDGTRISRLPEHMHVGGKIMPPGTLHDIQAFMEHHPSGAKLCMYRTQHQRMALHERLQNFPDLWRVMTHLDINSTLYITPNTDTTGFGIQIIRMFNL